MGRLRNPSDAWRFLYCHLIGSVEALDNARVNLFERMFPEKIDESKYASVDGKVCIVTGANAGIGLITSKLLAERGAHVIMACRSKERANEAAKNIRNVSVKEGCSAPKVDVHELDLASLKSVNGFCDDIMKKKLDLKLIVCNAGLMRPPKRQETQDGMEMQFQVNYLGHWLLSHRLMSDQIRRKTKESTRVVMVSSMAHLGGDIDFEDIHGNKSYDGFLRYADSKLANIIGAKEFQRRFDKLDDKKQFRHTAVSVHPGLIDTRLAREFMKGIMPGIVRPIMDPVNEAFLLPATLRDVEKGGQSVIAACLAPDDEVSGKYMVYGKVANCAKVASDPEMGRRLWKLSESLTSLEDIDLLA
ncbi:hypothetical protein BSKO_13025 [Bryopsis sp. KO-2023]|nr:hypothetical protein BSKO_13025 [Bryopsis sp. KO-2023]